MARKNPIVPVLLAAALAGALAAPAAAQSPILDHGSNTSAWFQVQRPSFEGGGSAWLINAGAVGVTSPGTQFLFEVPLVWVTEDGVDKKILLGNPYLAFRARTPSAFFELGMRAPAVGDNSAWVPAGIGAAADFDNVEAYLPNILTLAATAGYDTPAGKDAVVTHIRAGVANWIATKGHDDSQLMGSYTGLIGYRSGVLEIDGGITGRIILNNYGNASFDERTIHQGLLGVRFLAGSARPALFLRLPLDQDAKNLYSTVIGMGVSMDLR